MREYVEATYGSWDDAQQAEFHRAWFDPDRVKIIERDGQPIGVLDATAKADYVYLSRIEVAPEWQGRGVGTTLIRALTERNPVRLHVFASNLRARALYERLGFVAAQTEDARTAMVHPGPSK
jgi:ribosomal protein S18 acetylase RimI-like enzyme